MNKQLFVCTYLCTLLFSPRFAHICCCVRNTSPSRAALLQCLALGSYFCCLCPPPSEPVGFLGCFVLLALLHMAASIKHKPSNRSCKWVRPNWFSGLCLKHHTQLGTARL